jgi:hypothetical protein
MEALVEMTLAGAARPGPARLGALKDGGLPCVR